MLRQKSFLSFLLNIIGSLLGFVSVFFVSRFMGPEAMGALSSSTAFVALFAIFGDFGFGIAHYKKVSEGKDLGKCIGTFLRIRIITTIIMGAVTLLAFYGSYFFFGKYPINEKYLPLFYIVFVSGLLGNLLYVITYTFTARVEKAKEGASTISQKFVNSMSKVVVAVTGMGVIFLAWSNLAGVLVGAMVSIFLFRKYPIGKFEPELFKSYLTFAGPSILIGVTETISMNLDKVFISYFSGTEKVGYYTSAQSLVMILSYVGVIFVSLLLPTFSSLYAENRMEDIRKLAFRVERYISILLMPLVFFVFFFSDPLRLLVLGDKFAPSTPIISLLAINAMLVIFNQPYSSQLLGTNQIRLGMILGLIMLGVNILFNLFLIPEQLFGIQLAGMGPLGASISLVVSSFVGTLLFRYYAFKTSESKPNYQILIHLVLAVISFGIMYFIHGFLHTSIFLVPIYFITGLGLFLLLMALVGQFTRADFLYYLNMVSPKLMKNYIQKELKDS